MINWMQIKKYSAVITAQMITATAMYLGIVFFGLLGGIGLMLIGMLISLPIAVMMLKNPFTDMLEGKGLLAINMDSTGILQTFIIKLQAPLVKGKVNGKEISDVWDRETTFNLQAPIETDKVAYYDDKTGKLKFELDSSNLAKARFGFMQYPVFIYNQQLDTLLTKDFFAEKEKMLFTEHQILYLNRKVEELTTWTLHFARQVVEFLKPKKLLGNAGIWLVVVAIIIIAVIGVMFAPALLDAFGAAGGAATEAATNAGGAVTRATP